VRDLFVTGAGEPATVGVAALCTARRRGCARGGLITDHDLWIFFRTDVVFFFYLGGLVRMRGVPVEIGWNATIALIALYVR